MLAGQSIQQGDAARKTLETSRCISAAAGPDSIFILNKLLNIHKLLIWNPVTLTV